MNAHNIVGAIIAFWVFASPWLKIALLLMAIGLLMIICGIILTLIKSVIDIIKSLFYLLFVAYDVKNVHKPLGEANWTKEELEMIDQIEYSRRLKEKKSKSDVYEGILAFTNRMKSQYPKADPELFEKVENAFLQAYDIRVFKDYEVIIRDSHEKNMNKENDYKKYTLEDLDKLEPIEEMNYYPLIVKLYEIDKDYILRIYDKSKKEEKLYQSTNFNIIEKYIKEIEDKFTNVKSVPLDEFFK